MECYTLWTADNWLSRKSFILHGVFSDTEKAITYAKSKQLMEDFYNVVINKGKLNNYDATCEKVFSTEFDTNRKVLVE